MKTTIMLRLDDTGETLAISMDRVPGLAEVFSLSSYGTNIKDPDISYRVTGVRNLVKPTNTGSLYVATVIVFCQRVEKASSQTVARTSLGSMIEINSENKQVTPAGHVLDMTYNLCHMKLRKVAEEGVQVYLEYRLAENRLDRIDEFLKEANTERIDAEVLLTILFVIYDWRHKLQQHAGFLKRAETVIRKERGKVEAEKSLRRIKDINDMLAEI
jgi:hypothetical protein